MVDCTDSSGGAVDCGGPCVMMCRSQLGPETSSVFVDHGRGLDGADEDDTTASGDMHWYFQGRMDGRTDRKDDDDDEDVALVLARATACATPPRQTSQIHPQHCPSSFHLSIRPSFLPSGSGSIKERYRPGQDSTGGPLPTDGLPTTAVWTLHGWMPPILARTPSRRPASSMPAQTTSRGSGPTGRGQSRP